jgi:hypothetical protein
MRKVFAVALIVFALGSQAVIACGDKFSLLGRGARFRQAYAAIHPARILLVVPPKSVKQAAVRDARLKTALKMAGHKVDEVSSGELRRVSSGTSYDIILTGRADVSAVTDALLQGAAKPSIVAIVEANAPVEAAPAGARADAELKAPQSLPTILRLLDDMMKARIARARLAAS